MKGIKLINYTQVGKTYQVSLGNGTINFFNSKRDAGYFLAATNMFLCDRLKDLHTQYVDVWKSYQENWFYLDNNRKTNKNYLYTVERDFNKNLNSIKALLDLSVQRCGLTNGNYFVFINFLKITDYLESTVRQLATLYGKHSNTNAISLMDIYIRRAMYARVEINNYGKRSTTKLFVIPKHISEKENYTPHLIALQVA
jgi:hypothetical protein